MKISRVGAKEAAFQVWMRKNKWSMPNIAEVTNRAVSTVWNRLSLSRQHRTRKVFDCRHRSHKVKRHLKRTFQYSKPKLKKLFALFVNGFIDTLPKGDTTIDEVLQRYFSALIGDDEDEEQDDDEPP